MVLGLDLGTTTGWAYQIGNNTPLSGTWSNQARKGAGPGARFLNLERHLDAFLAQCGHVDFVAYERVLFVARGKRGEPLINAAQTWASFHATVILWCERNQIPYDGVAVQTLKKFATGNGRADKAEMKRFFLLQVGREPVDDNEADAFHALQWGQHTRANTWARLESDS